MNIENEMIFPTPIMKVYDFLNIDEINELKKLAYILAKNQNFGTAAIINSISTDRFSLNEDDKNIKDNPIILGFRKKLESAFKEFAKCHFNKEIEMTDAWFNIQKEGAVLAHHAHPECFISCAVYVNTDEKGNNIYFTNPAPAVRMYDLAKPMLDCKSVHSINPQTGMLIMFPSWLEHGSGADVNQCNERIVMSTNAILKKV